MEKQNSKNILTLANAELLLGKTLTGVDKNGRRFPYHYYPLVVLKMHDGRYGYKDRNNTVVPLDSGDEIPFGEALDNGEAA